jgi:hypothetical protein
MAPMTFETFKGTLADPAPPDGLSPVVQALWHEAKGDWHEAHRLAQSQDDADGAWVHAYLHRVEGDLANAGYWYRRAGKPASQAPLRDEWATIVKALLAD